MCKSAYGKTLVQIIAVKTYFPLDKHLDKHECKNMMYR